MAPQRLLTAAEYLELPDEKNVYRRDLIRGVLGVREPPPGSEHGIVQSKLLYFLSSFVVPRRLGVLGPHSGWWLEINPDTICAPDVWFISAERFRPEDMPPYPRGAPDLVVEVLSPSNRKKAMDEKVALYLGAGARLVWCVDPKRRSVVVHRPNREPVTVGAGDLLSGEDVVPGFECAVADLFDPYAVAR